MKLTDKTCKSAQPKEKPYKLSDGKGLYADKKRPQKFVTDYLEHARKWLKRHGLPVAYLYTLENGKNKGIHVHLLIHVPNGKASKAFKKAMAGWLPFEAKRPKVVFKSIQYPHYGELSPMHSLYGTLKYICKGIDPKTPLCSIKAIYQGQIMGRRWGISNLLKY